MRWEMVHPQVKVIDDDEEAPAGQLLPVYPLTEGLAQWHVRQSDPPGAGRLRRAAGRSLSGRRIWPRTTCWPIREALPQLHFPASRDELERARRRLVYQELFDPATGAGAQAAAGARRRCRRRRWS